jgi:hypothetical protein
MDKRIYANIDFFRGPAVCCKPDVNDGAGGRALLYPAREPLQATQQGRRAADCGEYCEAARAIKPPSDVGVLIAC